MNAKVFQVDLLARDGSVSCRVRRAIGLATYAGSPAWRWTNYSGALSPGIGRSSLLVALVLMSLGTDLDEALAAIGNARSLDVPETEEQRSLRVRE